jgi:hypothetical protein
VFARARPAAAFDRAPGEPGAASEASRAARPEALTDVSEWAVDEVAVALRLTAAAATALLTDCVLLEEKLPATLATVEDGRIGWAHARVVAELLAPLGDEPRPTAEARVLARAEGKTPAQLRVAARRALLQADPAAAAQRVALAVRSREVRYLPGEDGLSTLAALLPAPVGLACHDALAQYATACRTPGDERTTGQRMADCLADLILRPGATGLPPVQAQLSLIASSQTLLGGDEPGEVGGELLPAPLVRELADTLGLLPRTALRAAPDELATGGPGSPAGRAALADLLDTRSIAGTALAHRPRIAVVDQLSGSLVALTDAVELRRSIREGRGLGPPQETPGYRPAADLDRFVRLRDRRCRFPGCRARPRACDLDHTCPYPAGPTRHDNLCCLCEHHHRLSHQAPGWALRATRDGGLEWTTPSGEKIITHPPRYGADDDHPITVHASTGPTSDAALEQPAPGADDDPPPF